jgi:hypothetical protein
MKNMNHSSGKAIKKGMQGSTILEVLIAIMIFVFGMLALAHLQTNLTRSSTDANTRTVATNIGEEILEFLRGYRYVESDPDGIIFAFADIDDAFVSATIPPRGGINYTPTGFVTGYNFNADRTAVTATYPAIAGTLYDFKRVELTVAWDNNPSFQVDETTQVTNTAMGTGSITLQQVIPSIPSLASAKVAADDDGKLGHVPTVYTPGLNPDIIALKLSPDKFKESLTPKPEVIRKNDFVETWFDVITYNLITPDNFFLRREEFLVVSCDCTLRAPSGPSGFMPTTWSGTEYEEGEFVAKPYGEEASSSQSFYCATCCRDHHDGGAGTTPADQLYDPRKTWTAGTSATDHEHYGRDRRGLELGLTDDPVDAGDEYLEVCRMVRKDGFMRVAQDFRQEQFIGLPQSYLADPDNAVEYAEYVIDAIDDFVSDYLGGDPTPSLSAPDEMTPWVRFPADDGSNRFALAHAALALPEPENEQFVTRGIYIDHITAETATLLDCIAPASLGGQGKTAEECGAEDVTNYLEVFSFFDVQLTWLSLWEEDVGGIPVTVTNEALEDENTHSRGFADTTSTLASDVTVNSWIHRGNVGISATDPIDHFYYTDGLTDYDMFVDANGGGGGGGGGGTEFSGSISTDVKSVSASGTTFTGSTGVTCSLGVTIFTCSIALGAVDPTLKISGYRKGGSGTDLWVCEDSGTYPGGDYVQTVPKSTTFDLSLVTGDTTGVSFTITDSLCL